MVTVASKVMITSSPLPPKAMSGPPPVKMMSLPPSSGSVVSSRSNTWRLPTTWTADRVGRFRPWNGVPGTFTPSTLTSTVAWVLPASAASETWNTT